MSMCSRPRQLLVAVLTKQIIHVAAPLLDNPANTDYERDFLKPSVDGYACQSF